MTLADKILGKVHEDRIPLEVLLERVVTDLYMVFRQNGFKSIGFTLIAHALDSEDVCAMGNLKPDGIKVLLENCLEEMNKVAEADEDGPKH